MNGYSVKIAEASKELSAKEKVMLKDTSDAIKLDSATTDGGIVINPIAYVVLDIHNEKADDKDYSQYVIIGNDGTKYVTGSESFWNAFMDIYTELANCDEAWGIKVYRLPSNNFKGKEFLTCSVI